MDCPTVRIKATTGSYPSTTINESDFDPAKHTLYLDDLVDRLMQYEAPAAPLEASAPMPDVLPEVPAAAPKRGRK